MLFILCCIGLMLSVFGQRYDSLYTNPEVIPRYPTGDVGFYEELTNQLSPLLSPFAMDQLAPNGYRAIIGFVVNTDGVIDSVFHDNRSTHFFLQDQIHRAYRQTQPWQPGRVDGEPVATLVYMEFILTGSDPVWQLYFQPLFPQSAVLANTRFDKKWTKWAILGVIATVGLFYLLISL